MKKVVGIIACIVLLAGAGIAWRAKEQPEKQIKAQVIQPPVGLSIPISGVTNSSGVYAVTYNNPFTIAPNLQANVISGNANQQVVITSTAAGFTVTVTQRAAVTILGIEVLLAATTPVNVAKVDVLITAKE